MATRLPEANESLWLLTASPVIWAAHFLLCYGTAAVWCAKVVGLGGPLDSARIAIGVYTALALAAIGIIGWNGHHRHSFGQANLPHDDDTPEDRHRFLGHDRTTIDTLIDKVNRAACDLDSVVQRLLPRFQTRKRREQRGVDIHDALVECTQKISF